MASKMCHEKSRPLRLRSSHLTAFLAVFLLAGCATIPPHEALPATAQEQIASTDVVFPIQQSEIYVFVPNSNVAVATGGGLLGALIDAGINSVRTSNAETAVKPLRDALVDYHFDAAMQAAVKSELGQIPWIHAEDYRVLRDITANSTDGALAGSKDSAVLFVTADYRLSNDGDVLDITTVASLFPKSDVLAALKKTQGGSGPKTALANSIYHNTFVFEATLPGATQDRDQNIAAWSANNGAEMRNLLDQGAKAIAEMVAADLQGGDQPDTGTATVAIKNIKGKMVKQDNGSEIVRFDDGTMRYDLTAAAHP
jgi:hypothetical protein